MNHTPGPWKVKNIENAGGDICVMSHNGYVAIACTRNEGLINAEANARLIAAAPDLLGACRIALDDFQEYFEHITSIAGTIEILRQAISRAEGREEK